MEREKSHAPNLLPRSYQQETSEELGKHLDRDGWRKTSDLVYQVRKVLSAFAINQSFSPNMEVNWCMIAIPESCG